MHIHVGMCVIVVRAHLVSPCFTLADVLALGGKMKCYCHGRWRLVHADDGENEPRASERQHQKSYSKSYSPCNVNMQDICLCDTLEN